MRSINVHYRIANSGDAEIDEGIHLSDPQSNDGDRSRRRCVKPSCKLQQFSLCALRAWSVAQHGRRQEQEDIKGQEGWQEEGVSASACRASPDGLVTLSREF